MNVNSKIVITFCLLTLVVSFLTLPRVTWGYASDNSTVSVNVGAVSEITVVPTAVSWSGVAPGSEDTPVSLDVRNTGSNTVSQLHAYMSTLDNETFRPYGGDTVGDYAATGVIMISNESNATMYYAGRIEWNWTEDITYKDITALGATACDAGHNCSWGFIRNSSYEFMWAASNGTDLLETGLCNFTDSQLILEDDVDTGASDGSTRTPTITGITNDGADGNWSYFTVSRANHLLEHTCVALSQNCTKLYIYKYDMRSDASGGDFDTCSNAAYLQLGTMAPRDEHTITLNTYMPYGIPDGNMAAGIIYVEAKT
jgi:hypothetical protein